MAPVGSSLPPPASCLCDSSNASACISCLLFRAPLAWQLQRLFDLLPPLAYHLQFLFDRSRAPHLPAQVPPLRSVFGALACQLQFLFCLYMPLPYQFKHLFTSACPWPLALHLKTLGCLHAHRRVFKVLAAHATPTSDVLSSLGLRPQATLNSGSVSQWHRPLSPVRLLPSGAPPLASTSSTFARELSDSPGLCPSLLLKASCF